MTSICSFTVWGTPKGKGSIVKANGRYIPAGTTKTRKEITAWQDAIRTAAREAMGDRKLVIRPIRLGARFMLKAPKGCDAYSAHITYPDVDKLLRMLFDALTGIVYTDDAQVCAVYVSKVYASERTGAHITIDALDDDNAAMLVRAGAAIEAAIASGDFD